MRTTLNIAAGVFAQAKRAAAETHRTLGEVVEDALREAFARHRQARTSGKVKLAVFKGDGVQPGINLDKTSELLDLTERRHGSA